jgi:hypothetical protein
MMAIVVSEMALIIRTVVRIWRRTWLNRQITEQSKRATSMP